MNVPITGIKVVVPDVQVRAVKKIAPCGHCRREVDRDKMWAVNIKVFSPDDKQKHIQIRLCAHCAGAEVERAEEMRWDNSEMRVVE
jgi:hypothetical protein